MSKVWAIKNDLKEERDKRQHRLEVPTKILDATLTAMRSTMKMKNGPKWSTTNPRAQTDNLLTLRPRIQRQLKATRTLKEHSPRQ